MEQIVTESEHDGQELKRETLDAKHERGGESIEVSRTSIGVGIPNMAVAKRNIGSERANIGGATPNIGIQRSSIDGEGDQGYRRKAHEERTTGRTSAGAPN